MSILPPGDWPPYHWKYKPRFATPLSKLSKGFASHKEWDSFYCGCCGVPGPVPCPCLPSFAPHLFSSRRTFCSPCCPLSMPYPVPPQNFSTYISLLPEHSSSRYPHYLLFCFIPISVEIALPKKIFCGCTTSNSTLPLPPSPFIHLPCVLCSTYHHLSCSIRWNYVKLPFVGQEE